MKKGQGLRSDEPEDRSRKTEFITQKSKAGIPGRVFGRLVLICICAVYMYCLPGTVSFAAEKWQGVDESVIEKIAKEHGREAREPLINTDQGDLLLFVFLLAGTIGGFAAGYYYRTLTERTVAQGKKARDNAPAL